MKKLQRSHLKLQHKHVHRWQGCQRRECEQRRKCKQRQLSGSIDNKSTTRSATERRAEEKGIQSGGGGTYVPEVRPHKRGVADPCHNRDPDPDRDPSRPRTQPRPCPDPDLEPDPDPNLTLTSTPTPTLPRPCPGRVSGFLLRSGFRFADFPKKDLFYFILFYFF